jgi:hypothetical protein
MCILPDQLILWMVGQCTMYSAHMLAYNVHKQVYNVHMLRIPGIAGYMYLVRKKSLLRANKNNINVTFTIYVYIL